MPGPRGGLVYHWRHGWIPRDHAAALAKAHGSKSGAAKIMDKHGIAHDAKAESDGAKRLRQSTNEAAAKHGLPFTHGDKVRITTAAGDHYGTGVVAGISPDGHNVHVRKDGGGLEVLHRSSVHPAASPAGKDFRSMTSAEKIQAAAVMYGAGSKQHLAAKKRFAKK